MAQDKIEYRVTSVNQYEDNADTILDGGVARPKRKTQVTMTPNYEKATGVFAKMNSAPGAAYIDPNVTAITLTFAEHEGPFPWSVGSVLELSPQAASKS